MQLLLFAAFAFIILQRMNLYPPEKPGTVLDFDYTYRGAGYGFAKWSGAVWTKAGPAMTATAFKVSGRVYERLVAAFSPRGQLAKGPLTGGMAIWTATLLGVTLSLAMFS